MENECRAGEYGLVTAFDSEEKDGDRHYWFRHNETDEIFTLPVVEVKRLVATEEWIPAK